MPPSPPKIRPSPYRVKSWNQPSEYVPDLHAAADFDGDVKRGLIPVKNIAQPNDFWCHPCCVAMICHYWGVGPKNVASIAKILGTTRKYSTDPRKEVAFFKSLGLQVEDKHEMTLEHLMHYWKIGWPVLLPIQEYGDPTEEEKHPDAKHKGGEEAAFDYGHAVVYVGGPALGLIFVQDPSLENIMSDEHGDEAKGLMPIPVLKFLKVWHDKDQWGHQYVRYGIACGPLRKSRKALGGFKSSTPMLPGDSNQQVGKTNLSGGNVFGQTPMTDKMRSVTYGIGEGFDPKHPPYDANHPEHRVKSEEGVSTPSSSLPHRTLPHLTKLNQISPHHTGLVSGEESDSNILSVSPKIKKSDSKHPQTLAIDLDGTLAEYDTWRGEDHFGEMRKDSDGYTARDMMQELKRDGYELIINTTRGNTELVRHWLEENQIPYDYINENPNQPEGSSDKMIADLYVDDRGVDARGKLKGVKQEIERRLPPVSKSKYSSTQFNLSEAGYPRTQGSPTEKIKELQNKILDDDLADDGKEDTFHVTCLYGIHSENPEDILPVVEEWVRQHSRTIYAKLGEVSIFAGGEDKDYDVIKIDVESEDLHFLNKALKEGLEHTDKYDKFSPHLTLAYVKKGLGEQYAQGLNGMWSPGHEILFHKLHFSDRNRKHTIIDLWNIAKENEGDKSPSKDEPYHTKLHSTKLHHTMPCLMVEGSGATSNYTPTQQKGNSQTPTKCGICGGSVKKITEGEPGWRCNNPPCEWSIFAAGDEDMNMEQPGQQIPVRNQEPWERAGGENQHWERDGQLYYFGPSFQHPSKSQQMCPDGTPCDFNTNSCDGHLVPQPTEMGIEQEDHHIGGEISSQGKGYISPGLDASAGIPMDYPQEWVFYLQAYNRWRVKPDILGERRLRMGYDKRKTPQEMASRNDEEWRLKEQNDTKESQNYLSHHPVEGLLSEKQVTCPNGTKMPFGSGSCAGRQADSWDGVVDKQNEPGWVEYPDYSPISGVDTRDQKDREKPIVGRREFFNKKTIGEGEETETPSGWARIEEPHQSIPHEIQPEEENPPPVAQGMRRMYRGTREGELPHENAFFSDERGLQGVARAFAKVPGRRMVYVDVPEEIAQQGLQTGAVTEGEYKLPEEYRRQVRYMKFFDTKSQQICPDGTEKPEGTGTCAGREGWVPFTEEQRQQVTLQEPPKGPKPYQQAPLKGRYPNNPSVRQSPYSAKSLTSGDKKKRAEEADLITLPKGESGTRCDNCIYVEGDYCHHPSVLLELWDGADAMSCRHWWAEGAIHPDGSKEARVSLPIVEGSELERAKKADLITLPKSARKEGTSCSNCEYQKEEYCHNKKVDQEVEPNKCCDYWDDEGVERAWEKNEEKKGEKAYGRRCPNGTIEPPGLGTCASRDLPEHFHDSWHYGSVAAGPDHPESPWVLEGQDWKAMSWLGSGSGGDLVPPPQFGGKKPKKRKINSSPYFKMLYGVKATEPPYTGVFKDSLGRNTCYQNGVKVSCVEMGIEQDGDHAQQNPLLAGTQHAQPGLSNEHVQMFGGGSGEATQIRYALIFNEFGRLLVNEEDKEYGGFVWQVPAQNERETEEALKKQIDEKVQLFGKLGEAGSGEGYFLFEVEERKPETGGKGLKAHPGDARWRALFALSGGDPMDENALRSAIGGDMWDADTQTIDPLTAEGHITRANQFNNDMSINPHYQISESGRQHMNELQNQGAGQTESIEQDWRPTETIPEDYY